MNNTPKTVSIFYNNLFFDENDKPKKSPISLFIKSGENELIIPNVVISPRTEIHQVILDYHNRLIQSGEEIISVAQEEPAQEEPAQEEPAQEEAELINFEKIEHKGRIYFIEEDESGKIIILNEDRTKEINYNAPLARAIRKNYNPATEK